MKSVDAEDQADVVESDGALELQMRQMGRSIFEQTFPNEKATAARIEAVTREIVITNDDGFVEDAIQEEKAHLLYARKWALQAYRDDSPEATMLAYDVLYGATAEERHWDIIERLDKLGRKK
jgi:hypothetical protein